MANRRFDNEYVDKLTAALHRKPAAEYVFWQTGFEFHNFMASKGDTVKVNAPEFLPKYVDPIADAKLAGITTKWTDQATQEFTENQQSVVLQEYLMKKPTILYEWDKSYAEHSVVDINEAVMAEDYNQRLDDHLIKLHAANTFRTYGNLKEAAAAMTKSGSTSDQASFDIFSKARLQLSSRHIPKLGGGLYMCYIDEKVEATLFLDQRYQDNFARALAQSSPVFTGEIGEIFKLKFVVSDNVPTVTVGQSGTPFEASQCFLYGASTYDAFPIGTFDGFIGDRAAFLDGKMAGPIGKVTGAVPAEVRVNVQDDMGRQQIAGWIEHMEAKMIDPGVTVVAGKTVGVDSRFQQVLYVATLSS